MPDLNVSQIFLLVYATCLQLQLQTHRVVYVAGMVTLSTLWSDGLAA